MSSEPIVVLGAGVAGVSTAIGLKKLGFDVVIIYKDRAFEAYEGLSQRSKESLQMLGCINSANLLKTPSLRDSNWAKDSKKVNHEYVVSRKEFDEALKIDAKSYGVLLINASVKDVRKEDSLVFYKDYEKKRLKSIKARYIVDARGRFTPYKKEYLNSPKSTSILQELKIDECEKRTSIDSISNGWIWQAHVGKKRAYLQFTCDEELANKIHNFEDVKRCIKDEDLELWTLKNYKCVGKLIKRDSYSKLHSEIVDDKMILVGDSASSIDPLSGNGVFQALSMSSVAAFVVNTILKKEENKEIAKEFYKKRVTHIFWKFCTVGRDFYTLEKRFDTPFWQKRVSFPKDDYLKAVPVKVELGAIVKSGFIEQKEVLVTKDNPLGIYFLGRFEIVPLVKEILKNPKDRDTIFKKFCEKNSIFAKEREALLGWVNGVLKTTISQ